MKRSRSPIRDTKESLSHLTRRQLQQKAKTMGIKANMKSTDIIDAIIERLREDDELEEVASTRRVSHVTTAQSHISSVAPIDDCPLSHISRGRTRASPQSSQRHGRVSPTTIPQPRPLSGSIGGNGPLENEENETRCTKRRRLAEEEFERAEEEAAEMQEAARKAQQKVDVARAVALHLVNGDGARTPAQTIYVREPTPPELTQNHTPVASREHSPEEAVINGDEDIDQISPKVERLQCRVSRQMQASDGDGEESDEENGNPSDEELDKKNSAPSLAAPSLVSEELDATAYNSGTQSAGDSASPVPISPIRDCPVPASHVPTSPAPASPIPASPVPLKKLLPRPITKANIREAHRRLAETVNRLTDIRTQVKRCAPTIAKMEEHSAAGAKTLEGIQWKALALEENLMKHVKRNPTLLDGNAFDPENGGPARQEMFRRAYYTQRKNDRVAEEQREYERELARQEEEALMEAEEESVRMAEENGWFDDEDEEDEMNPDLAALIERGGDLSELLGDDDAGPSGSWSDEEEDSENEDEDEDEDEERDDRDSDSDSDSGESAHSEGSQEF